MRLRHAQLAGSHLKTLFLLFDRILEYLMKITQRTEFTQLLPQPAAPEAEPIQEQESLSFSQPLPIQPFQVPLLLQIPFPLQVPHAP